ncbi:MAG TPA: hypothetical protein VF470_09130, partial [Sphingomicrobium sp.]
MSDVSTPVLGLTENRGTDAAATCCVGGGELAGRAALPCVASDSHFSIEPILSSLVSSLCLAFFWM